LSGFEALEFASASEAFIGGAIALAIALPFSFGLLIPLATLLLGGLAAATASGIEAYNFYNCVTR
jgi:hypothetical protein